MYILDLSLFCNHEIVLFLEFFEVHIIRLLPFFVFLPFHLKIYAEVDVLLDVLLQLLIELRNLSFPNLDGPPYFQNCLVLRLDLAVEDILILV